ncbi:hypothetical protein BDQ12DRAFT_677886 [Crucibulum laeve]|uniref:F-box domain-containing protein n=1 Tax=Crucibulum laeve TaxID=68775 RepID=A0A5C3MBZ2_9AGAR|nr:hypothetical protein BDQ12DRAFT_677886 [Crucibulum laeve]
MKRIASSSTNAELEAQERLAPKRVKTRGKLALLPSLPLDILSEIFSHLLPTDILNLSRTTKDFRRVLLHRSATSIWKSAVTNVPNFPECPEDMSLPAWISLAYDCHCHNCLTSGVRNVDWMLRIRLCAKCAKVCLLSEQMFDSKSQKERTILHCVPFSDWNKSGVQYCIQESEELFTKQLSSLKKGRTAFVENKRAEMKARQDHAKTCAAWYSLQQDLRSTELNNLRVKRREAIIAKLELLGYKDDLAYSKKKQEECVCETWVCPFYNHPAVDKPQLLTERIWQNIKADIFKQMKKVRAARMEEERENLVQERVTQAHRVWSDWRIKHFTNELMPTIVDIIYWEPVRTLIWQPGNAALDLESLAAAFSNIEAFIEQWRESQIIKVFDLASRGLGLGLPQTHTARTGLLALAATAFSCTMPDVHFRQRSMTLMQHSEDIIDDYSCMWYPEFLHHHCNSVATFTYSDLEVNKEENLLDDCRSLRVVEYLGCRRRKWSTEFLSFDDKASKAVKNILEACRMDWKTTTTAEMDASNVRLVCLKCSFGNRCDGERMFTVMTWRNAVQHGMKVHWGGANVQWQRISDEDYPSVAALESKEPGRRGVPAPICRKWLCHYCRETTEDPGEMTLERLRQHFDLSHEIDSSDIVLHRDFYVALDSPPTQPLSVEMVPRAC